MARPRLLLFAFSVADAKHLQPHEGVKEENQRWQLVRGLYAGVEHGRRRLAVAHA